MTPEFHTFWCPTCGGVSHPATGSQVTAATVICRRCVEESWAWIRTFTASKGRRKGLAFYDHVNRIAPLLKVE